MQQAMQSAPSVVGHQNLQSYEPRLGKGYPAAAGCRPVDRAHFVGTESHGHLFLLGGQISGNGFS